MRSSCHVLDRLQPGQGEQAGGAVGRRREDKPHARLICWAASWDASRDATAATVTMLARAWSHAGGRSVMAGCTDGSSTVDAWVAALRAGLALAGHRRAGRALHRGRHLPAGTVPGPVVGLAAIAEMWEAERDGPDEVFHMDHETVAVDPAASVAVVRVEVEYGDPIEQEWADLWMVRFGPDGRCVAFEEWPFGRPSDELVRRVDPAQGAGAAATRGDPTTTSSCSSYPSCPSSSWPSSTPFAHRVAAPTLVARVALLKQPKGLRVGHSTMDSTMDITAGPVTSLVGARSQHCFKHCFNHCLKRCNILGMTTSDDTPSRLVVAAERLFAEQGEEATSLRAITRAAMSNAAAVHYHFGGRDGLLRAVLDRHLGPLAARRRHLLEAVADEQRRPGAADRRAGGGPATRPGAAGPPAQAPGRGGPAGRPLARPPHRIADPGTPGPVRA